MTGYFESANDDIYDNFFLRPEPQIRDILLSAPGPVLLKPISETFRRDLYSIFAEYPAYDLHIVWIYRDPVNVLYSQNRLGWIALESEAELVTYAGEWHRRNSLVFECLPQYSEQFTVVRFEDLCADPELLPLLGKRLGVPTVSLWKSDISMGRTSLPPEVQSIIERETRQTLERLHTLRTIKPRGDSALAATPGASVPPASGPVPSPGNPPGRGIAKMIGRILRLGRENNRTTSSVLPHSPQTPSISQPPPNSWRPASSLLPEENIHAVVDRGGAVRTTMSVTHRPPLDTQPDIVL